MNRLVIIGNGFDMAHGLEPVIWISSTGIGINVSILS